MSGGVHKTKQCPIVVSVETHARLKARTGRRAKTMDQVIAEALDALDASEVEAGR